VRNELGAIIKYFIMTNKLSLSASIFLALVILSSSVSPSSVVHAEEDGGVEYENRLDVSVTDGTDFLECVYVDYAHSICTFNQENPPSSEEFEIKINGVGENDDALVYYEINLNSWFTSEDCTHYNQWIEVWGERTYSDRLNSSVIPIVMSGTEEVAHYGSYIEGDEAGNYCTDVQYLTGTIEIWLDGYQLTAPEVDCSDEFQFDEGDDWIASTLVYANKAATMVLIPLRSTGFEDNGEYSAVKYLSDFFRDILSNWGIDGPTWLSWIDERAADYEPTQRVEFVPGNWYAIQTVAGDWYDGEDGPRYDLEYAWTDRMYNFNQPVWEDLGDTSDLIICETDDGGTYKTVYIQAAETDLLLRVNDEVESWSDNDGRIAVNIFDVVRNRTKTGCDQFYRIAGFEGTDQIAANQEEGKLFGEILNQTALMGSAVFQFEPDAWYSLRTSEGPWGYVGSVYDSFDYNLEVKSNNTELGWEPLEEWSEAACIVETDPLGHVNVFFQTPDLVGREYEIRVGDSEAWTSNVGEMRYSLYNEISLDGRNEDESSTSCDFEITDLLTSGIITGSAQSGVAIPQLGEYSNLDIYDVYYALKILDDSAWQELSGDVDNYSAQITDDGGWSWTALADYEHLICLETDGDETTIYLTGQTAEDEYKLRVNSESFADNTGALNYEIYATVKPDPWSQCFDNYDQVYRASTFIPVKDEAGIMAGANYTLMPGYSYGLEIQQGPWLSDEDDNETISYRADVSPDNGTTWYPLDGSSDVGGVACASVDHADRYAQLIFNVTDSPWKIRVSDNAGDFADNGGNLSFDLYSVELEEGETPVIPVLDSACYGVCLRPESTLTDWQAGAWIEFLRCYIQTYFAWCPRHTSVISHLGRDIASREPFATMSEFGDVMGSIRVEMDAYSWTDENAPDSAIDGDADIDQHLLNRDPGGPWMGGDLINFSASPSYKTYVEGCQSALTDIVSAPIQQGACFVSAQTRATGFSFWMQLLIDVAAVVMFISAGSKFSKSVGIAVR